MISEQCPLLPIHEQNQFAPDGREHEVITSICDHFQRCYHSLS